MPILTLVGSRIWGWLRGASFWQIACVCVCIFAGVQHFQLADARHDRDAYRKQRDEYRSTLDQLAKESADRQKQTEKVIADLVKRGNREAERVENAPLPGLCKTPSEVLQADL